MSNINVIVHEIAEDGLPEMEKLTGRVAFIWDGAIISGWPIDRKYDDGLNLWEGSEDRFLGPYAGVTHWLEFPLPFWELR